VSQPSPQSGNTRNPARAKNAARICFAATVVMRLLGGDDGRKKRSVTETALVNSEVSGERRLRRCLCEATQPAMAKLQEPTRRPISADSTRRDRGDWSQMSEMTRRDRRRLPNGCDCARLSCN